MSRFANREATVSRRSISLLWQVRLRTERVRVEVKIGVSDSPRELVFRSSQTQAEVEKLVSTALAKGTEVLSLADDKGRKFLVPTAKVAYVEIGAADVRRVGFAG
jgi:hypothetical protein